LVGVRVTQGRIECHRSERQSWPPLRSSPNRPILSYSATLVSNNSADHLRDFLATFYVEGSTFVVSEKPVFNSGIALAGSSTGQKR
jgi:hypothetical protein